MNLSINDVCIGIKNFKNFIEKKQRAKDGWKRYASEDKYQRSLAAFFFDISNKKTTLLPRKMGEVEGRFLSRGSFASKKRSR